MDVRIPQRWKVLPWDGIYILGITALLLLLALGQIVLLILGKSSFGYSLAVDLTAIIGFTGVAAIGRKRLARNMSWKLIATVYAINFFALASLLWGKAW